MKTLVWGPWASPREAPCEEGRWTDLKGLTTQGKCSEGRKQRGLWEPRGEPSALGADSREGFLEEVLSWTSKIK